MFVTVVWMGVLETSTARLSCCNAGHENPVIGKAGGTFARVEDHHPCPGRCWKPCVKRRWTLPAKRPSSMISRCFVSAGQGKCAPFTISKTVKGAFILSKMLPLSAALLQVFVLTLFFPLTKQFSLLKKKIRSLLEWIALKNGGSKKPYLIELIDQYYPDRNKGAWT